MNAHVPLRLEPDRRAVEQFVSALFVHADPESTISLRGFDDQNDGSPAIINEPVKVGSPVLIERACTRIREAAQHARPVVFCPPVATFRDGSSAKAENLANGVALSVECDAEPRQSLARLSALLGPPTVAVASGGTWADPRTGELEEKLHLHWRLAEPTCEPIGHAKLRSARELACKLVGADTTSISIVHPLRWPGSWHRKKTPRLAEIISSSEAEIDLDEALEKLGTTLPAAAAGAPVPAGRSDLAADDLLDIVGALAAIPNADLSWDDWNRIGMATWAASGGRAFSAFDMWSAKSTKHDTQATATRWDHYSSSPPDRIGAGTLFHLAAQNASGWTKPSHQARPERDGPPATGASPIIRAEPFIWRDPKTIPPREFVYGRHRVRRYVSATFANTGVGKTTLLTAETLSMVSGRALLGVRPGSRLRTWFWNGEDPLDETERRIAAACLHYGIKPEDLEGLFVGSGRSSEITIAASDRTGVKIAQPVVDALISTIRENEIDAVTIDPFVSSHRVSENDNMAIDAVAKTWARIAEVTNTSIELVHHVRKGQSGQGEYTVEDGRGAIALIAASRSARVLNVMSKEQAESAGVDRPRSFVRVDNGKSNMAAPAERAEWFHLVSVPLGNGFGGLIDDGDHVAVATAWEWPEIADDMTVEGLKTAQRASREGGPWRESPQSPAWIGVPIAKALGIELNTRGKKRVNGWLQTWTANGMFEVYEDEDKNRQVRRFVRVGEAA